MGVGRFAYTPLLPLMLDGAGLSHAMAGVVASSNLVGYLIGAFAASAAAFRAKRLGGVWLAIAVVIVTTAVMAVPSQTVWLLARLGTGIASGFAFVLGSSIVLDRAARERHPDWIAIFYSGVGAGIILSAVAVPPLGAAGGWRAGWLGLAAISTALAVVTLPWLTDEAQHVESRATRSEGSVNPNLFIWLVLAYTGNGFGYIIPATFMVAMIAATPSVARFAALSWVLVGIVAIPSTVVWNRLGISIGRDRALALALLVLGGGTVAPLFAPNALGVVIAAASLGGTFIGITALANALGRQLFPLRSHVAIGRLTAAFGIGQIVGPALAGFLVGSTGSYASALIVAAGVSCTSAVVMYVGSVVAGGAHSGALRTRAER